MVVIVAVGRRVIGAGRVVHRPRPGVRRLEREAMAEGVAEVSLQSVVAGHGRILFHAYAGIAREGLEEDIIPCLIDQETLSIAVSLRVTVRSIPGKLWDVDGTEPQRRLRQTPIAC